MRFPVLALALVAQAGANWSNPDWIGARSLVAHGTHRKNAVRIIDIGNGASREILPAESDAEAPFLSPDGKWLATFAKSRGNRVILVVVYLNHTEFPDDAAAIPAAEITKLPTATGAQIAELVTQLLNAQSNGRRSK